MEENKTLKEYLRKFLEGYKYVVENRYNYQFSSNPEASRRKPVKINKDKKKETKEKEESI
nr:hypothetical protein [Staphylococcus aureus]